MAEDGKTLWQRKRWLRRLTWTVGVLAVLFVLIVFVLPSPLARWVIASQLEDLGIQHDGVGTVDIDLWNRNVSAGPIAVHSGDHSPATLGSVNIAYSLKNVIEKRALIKTFTLTGVDIVATRHVDGTITVNGIAPPAAEGQKQAEAQQPADEEEGGGYGVGVSTFVFQDSKLILKDFTGGALTLDLQRLELSDFHSWEPERPGTYSLAAGLNGMVIEMNGEAMPFAKTIRAKGNISFSSLTLDGVAAFVGPTGMERQGGEFSLVLQHDVTLAPDGQIRADVNGKAVIREADIATAAGEELTLAELDNPFEMILAVAPDNAVEIKGQSEFTLRNIAVRGSNQETLKAAGITLQLSAMDLVKLAALREGIEPPTASGNPGAAGGTGGAQPLISLLLTALIDAGKEVLQHQLEGTAGVAVTLMDVEAVQPATSSAIRLKSGEIAAAGVRLRSTGPFWTMSTPLSVTLDGLDAGSADSKAAIGQVVLNMENFEGQTDFRDASISAAIDLTVNALTAAGGGSETSLESLTLKTGALSITEEGESGTLETGLNLETGAFRMTGNGMDAALESLQVNGERLKISEAPDRHSVEGDLQATLGAFRITAGGAKAALASLQVNAAPLSALASGGETSLDAGLTLEAGKLDVEAEGAQAGMDGLSLQASSLKAGGPPGAATLSTAMSSTARGVNIALGGEAPAKVSATQIAMAFDPLSFAQANGNTSVSGKIEVQNADAEADGTAAKVASLVLALKNIAGKVMPAPDLKGGATLSAGNISVSQAVTGMQASVGSVEVQADSLQVSEAENALSGGVKVASVEAKMEGEEPVNATVGGVDITGLSLRLPAGSAPAVAVNNIMIDALQAEVSVAAFGKQGQQPAEGNGSTGGSGGAAGSEAPKISMQSLTVSPGSSVTVIDNSTGEAVRIPVAVEKLTAGPLDMAAPGQTTNLDVALGIGDAAKVTAAGTATPLASTPDFDLTTNVASFPLPLVSPYVTQLSGLTVESGTLNMNAAAAANSNALTGKIDVRVGDFHLGEPDSETAARFQENYGVPVGLAVSVLKDSDGVIELSLPVSGTVSEPSVDYSAVISKAIGGALTSLFPSGLLSSDAGFGIEPVLFEPGSAELTAEAQAAADPLVSALKAKSELRLRVCGKGARADFLAMRNLAPDAPLPAEKVSDQEAQDLLKLAQERGGALRQYFVSNGIAEQRIGECRTSYSVESDAPPRAEVQL